jgi:DNA-binding response OmpR family regulator
MSKPKKIMIIDDEVDLTQLIGFQFKARGFEVQTAGDGLEALEKIHQFSPDLIILDMNMPRMGGIEFYSKICGKDGRPLYPVLVLTARANVKELFKDLDIDGFIIKPFDIDKLIGEAELIIKKKNAAERKARSVVPRTGRKVCIVENDPKVFDQLTAVFFGADYSIVPAKSGLSAIEKMMNDVPDVALVHLGLPDLPGDLVILKLSQMAKTMDVRFVLYTFRGHQRDQEVLKRIAEKKGVMSFIEYQDPRELLEAVDRCFEPTDD